MRILVKKNISRTFRKNVPKNFRNIFQEFSGRYFKRIEKENVSRNNMFQKFLEEFFKNFEEKIIGVF